MKNGFSFELDKQSKKDFEKFLKEAAELPKKRLSHAVKEGGKVAMAESKAILNSTSDTYTMAFGDGNTWRKQDIIDNLTLKLEKAKRSKIKRVVRVGIKDWRVSNYSNFGEYGYTNPRTGQSHKALHFMRDGLTNKRYEVEEVMIEDLRKSLDKLR